MEKSEKVSKVKVIYFLLIAVLIVVAIVGDVIVFGKLDNGGLGGDIKGTMIIISVIIIAMAMIIGAAMFKFVADEERVSTVKSDKYKKLFLNLPVGFAQAQILRDVQTGRNMGYRITDANETFARMFELDFSDYYGKVISESRVEVLQDINAWFEAYNNSGTKLGELLTVEITMEKLDKVFNTVMYLSLIHI